MIKTKRLLIISSLMTCLLIGGCSVNETTITAPAPTETSVSAELLNTEKVLESTESTEYFEETESATEPMTISSTEEATTEILTEPFTDTLEKETMGSEDNDIHGIIVMVVQVGNTSKIDVICVDPSNGNMQTISTFKIPIGIVTEDGKQFSYSSAHSFFSPPPTYSIMFSSDYAKLTASKCFQNYELHAGWINVDGSFTDVTEILNPELHDGFYELPQHYAIGFTEDGNFIYSEEFMYSTPSYQVPLSNLSTTAIQEYNPYRLRKGDAELSNWINDNECLVSYRDINYITCKIYNISTQEYREFIPENSRCNWSGVANPDDTIVAFLSKASESDGNAEIFTIPINGGEPTKVPMKNTLQSLYGDIEISYPALGGVFCRLIGWK